MSALHYVQPLFAAFGFIFLSAIAIFFLLHSTISPAMHRDAVSDRNRKIEMLEIEQEAQFG